MFIGGTIYIMQQDRLREWSGIKPMSPHEIPIDEHSSCSGVQESGGGDGGEGCWGCQFHLKIKGTWGGLQKDVGLSRRGCRQSHRVIHTGTLTIHWCGFSLVGLRHRRGGWIMMVFTVRSNYRRQLGCMLHQLWLQNPLSPGVFSPSNSGRGIVGMDRVTVALRDSARNCKSLGASLGIIVALMFWTFWGCGPQQTFMMWPGLPQLKQRP